MLVGHDFPHWADSALGGWSLGGLWIWESGQPFTVSSGFATGQGAGATFANYTGSRNIGGITTSPLGPGVYYFTPTQIANFSEPVAGSYRHLGPQRFPRAGLLQRRYLACKAVRDYRAQSSNVPRRGLQPVQHRRFRQPSGDSVEFQGFLRQNQWRGE